MTRVRAIDDLGGAGVDHGYGVADGAGAVRELGIDDDDDALFGLPYAAAEHRSPAVAVAAVEDADGERKAVAMEKVLDGLERRGKLGRRPGEGDEHGDGRAHARILARTRKVLRSTARR
jgi:hypothetical protein